MYQYHEVVERIENARRFGKLPGVEVTKRMLEVLGHPEKILDLFMWPEPMEKDPLVHLWLVCFVRRE